MKALAVATMNLAALLLCGCSDQQSALDPAGDQAARLLTLFQLMLWICGIAYLLLLLFLGWSFLRCRRTQEADDKAQSERRLESLLGVWIGLILVGLTLLILGSFLSDRSLGETADGQVLHIRVTGHQWWWRIEYRQPSGQWIETANEMHLPAGRSAVVELRSADVIHSFWVPNLAGKTDMIPGRSNSIVITPRTPGTYRGQCAEFCGVQHANMAFLVKVEAPATFGRWLAAQARPAGRASPSEARGYALVMGGSCSACHHIGGTPSAGRVGPDLTHFASRSTIAAGTVPLTHASLRGWILQPQGVKPGNAMPASDFSPQDAQAVARYLETLK